MKSQVDIAVIIPAGPRDDVLDTLESVVYYTGPSRIIVVIDDRSTLRQNAGRISELSKDLVVIPASPKALGAFGGLWVNLSAAYRWVLERYEPRIILRMDTDALLIGPGLEEFAEEAFAKKPSVGLLGSYRIGPDGQSRDLSWAADQLHSEVGIRGLLHLKCRSTLRNWLHLARSHGYVDGESVLGGAYIHRYEAAERISKLGWFDRPCLLSSKLGEDHIMSLLTMAAGFDLGEFGGPMDPMALRWRGLPAHPADLLAANKLVTHSVRSWQNLGEREIRNIFSNARQL
jgi:hypothetical protein